MDGTLPPSPLTANAVQNEPLLRAIARGPHASAGALAEAAGVLQNNLSRKLGVLREEGLIAPIFDKGHSHEVKLTGLGRDALAALDRAHAAEPAPANGVRLTHDRLRPDPDNARTRSGLAGEDFEGLVASVREKGILARIEVRAAGADGVHTILKGERRWRAWGRLIEAGDWPAGHTEPVEIVLGDDEHLTEVAIIDNVQRADLDNLEKAEAYFKLHRRFGRSPQVIAARIGATDRHVQELLRVAEKATAEAKAAYWQARDEGVANAWTTLRDSVKTPRHLVELEKSPRMRLLVVELACRSQAANSVWDDWVTISTPPGGGLPSLAIELGLLRTEYEPGNVRAQLTALASDWLGDALGGGDDATGLLAETRQAALGPMGALAVPEGQWATLWLNPPPPKAPHLEPPAAEAAPSPPPPGDGGGRPGALGFVGDDFSRQLREAAADGGETDETGEAGETIPPPAPDPEPLPLEPEPLTLPPKQRLAVIEIAHKTARHGQETRGGAIRGAPVGAFHAHADSMRLIHDGLAGFNQNAANTAYLAVLTQKGWDYLAAEGFADGVTDEALAVAVAEALTPAEVAALAADDSPIDCATRYATPWLNAAPAKRRETAPPAPKPPADPVVQGFRTAFADLHAACDNALVILSRILAGDGAGEDEIGQVVDQLKAALANGQPYLPKDAG